MGFARTNRSSTVPADADNCPYVGCSARTPSVRSSAGSVRQSNSSALITAPVRISRRFPVKVNAATDRAGHPRGGDAVGGLQPLPNSLGHREGDVGVYGAALGEQRRVHAEQALLD